VGSHTLRVPHMEPSAPRLCAERFGIWAPRPAPPCPAQDFLGKYVPHRLSQQMLPSAPWDKPAPKAYTAKLSDQDRGDEAQQELRCSRDPSTRTSSAIAGYQNDRNAAGRMGWDESVADSDRLPAGTRVCPRGEFVVKPWWKPWLVRLRDFLAVRQNS